MVARRSSAAFFNLYLISLWWCRSRSDQTSGLSATFHSRTDLQIYVSLTTKMKMFGASANVGTILCSLIALASVVASRIVGCDTLDCRLEDDENKNNCPLSDDGVGTTTFQSNATSDGPLTWSVVGNTDRFTTQEASKGAKRIMKSFYLGTPSTLLLQNADFRGCSLVFFNITPALQTVPGYDDFPNFGCDTVLGSQCATDLLEQARQELNSRLSASPLGSVCDAIGKVLTDTLPHSCRLPFGRTSWGPINVVGTCLKIESRLNTDIADNLQQVSPEGIMSRMCRRHKATATLPAKAPHTIQS